VVDSEEFVDIIGRWQLDKLRAHDVGSERIQIKRAPAATILNDGIMLVERTDIKLADNQRVIGQTSRRRYIRRQYRQFAKDRP